MIALAKIIGGIAVAYGVALVAAAAVVSVRQWQENWRAIRKHKDGVAWMRGGIG